MTDKLREELRGKVRQIVKHQKTTRADIANALGLPYTRLRDILVNPRVRYVSCMIRENIIDLHTRVIAGRVKLAVSHQGHEVLGEDYVLITDEIRRMIREIYKTVNRRGIRRVDISELVDEVSSKRFINLVNTAEYPADRNLSRKVLKKIKASELEAFRKLARKWRTPRD